MAKRGRPMDRTGRSIGGASYVGLHRWMLRSEAWKHASLGARCLLIELYDLYNGANNGALYLSIRDAAKRLKVGKNKANSLFAELERLGFIRVKERGAFSLKARHASSWVLTEFSAGGQLPSKDFMRWPPQQNQNPIPRGGTDGPSPGDRETLTRPTAGTVGPSFGDREDAFQGGIGPSKRDTGSLPRGASLAPRQVVAS